MMPLVMINPGTEGRPGATLKNAEAIAVRLFDQLKMPLNACDRVSAIDDLEGGFFGFHIHTGDPGSVIELLIPGDDPEEFLQSKPLVSRRMYVDGSSWLYAYAVSAIYRRLGRDE